MVNKEFTVLELCNLFRGKAVFVSKIGPQDEESKSEVKISDLCEDWGLNRNEVIAVSEGLTVEHKGFFFWAEIPSF